MAARSLAGELQASVPPINPPASSMHSLELPHRASSLHRVCAEQLQGDAAAFSPQRVSDQVRPRRGFVHLLVILFMAIVSHRCALQGGKGAGTLRRV